MRVAIIENGLVVNIVEGAENLGPAAGDADIGDIYDGVNFTKPVPKLAQVQAVKLALIESAYQSANTQPIAYMGTDFQADANSQSLMAAVITASGGSLPAEFAWFDINNAPVAMTFAQLQGLANSILLRGQPLFVRKQTLKAQVRAATTTAEVEAIVW